MSKPLGKTRGSSGTHAHYAGEFGSRRQTPELAKLPEYRSARAEHFARVAQDAAMKHAGSTGADRAAHALVVEHAVKMSAKHANAAARMTPGGEHATRAVAAHEVAKLARASLAHVDSPITSTETRTVAAKEATKSAFAKTKIASESPNVKTQEAAAAAHREAARVNKGDDKTVALHERQAGHHQNRADAIRQEKRGEEFAPQVKQPNTSTPSHHTVHGVLAGAYKGVNIRDRFLHTHASIDGGQTALCRRVKEHSLCDAVEKAPPTCPHCLIKIGKKK